LKEKEHWEDSNEGKNKWKREKYNKIVATAHQWKYPSNHCNHCNIYVHTEEKKQKKDEKKNNLIAMYLSNQVESSSDVGEGGEYE
jgi:hypothetical protein